MHRFFLGLSKVMAIIGGFVLAGLVGMVVLSILGREANGLLHSDFFQNNMKGLADWLIELGVGPIDGDYELVESGMAFTIFAFLPLTQITGGHAVVDIFTSWMPEPVQRVLRMLTEIAFAVVLVIIAVQLYEGTVSKYSRGQTTFLLQFPIWWSYAASLVGATVAAIVSIYVAVARSAEALLGWRVMSEGMGADH